LHNKIAMARNHRRGPWVPEEDQTLLQLVREQGPNNWVRISQHMHFRSPKQCRERFHQNLKPSLNHAPISAEEGLLIERMVEEMGKRWAEIARRLGNRSDNAVKNWWNGSINRKRRGGGSGHHGHASRTCNGRIEAPYPRASLNDHSRYRSTSDELRRPSWSLTKPRLDLSSAPAHDDSFSTSSLVQPLSSDGYDYSPYHEDSHQHTVSRDDLHRLPPITITSKGYSTVEPAMTSPAFSEASNAPSMGPPSMVSDHNSISSASPRTAASPQVHSSSIPSRYSDAERRGSAPILRFHSPTNTSNDNLVFGTRTVDSTYISNCTQPQYTSHIPASIYHRHSNSVSDSTSHTAEERFHGQSCPPRSARDSRMGLDTLLN
jgi:Myb-like DNA-binding protein FlbD